MIQTSTPKLRFLRAYRVSLTILMRYLLLFVMRRLLGVKRCDKWAKRIHQKTSTQIVHHILALKGLYIKVGQTLSIMSNFLPPELTDGLEQLQDDVPPHPYHEIEQRFIQDFGKKPLDVFESFSETPLASASLGQVHAATLKTGQKVAVKLQYPNIEKIVSEDLKVIRRLFSLIHIFFPHYGLKQVYAECAQIILRELDYTQEGKNLELIQSHFQDDEQMKFPQVFWEHSSQRILTLEYIDGIKVSKISDLTKEGLVPRDIAIKLIHAYCKQIFIDGVYHADPHPGNIIITKNLNNEAAPFKITLLDFGACASISPDMKAGMILFVEGLIKRDTKLLSQGMKQMGFLAREDNDEAFDKIVEYFYSKIRGIKIDNFKQINLSEFQHLDDILELKKMDISIKKLSQTFHVPQEWILLERTLILMMGITAQLDPYLNPVDIVLPYVESFVLGQNKRITDILIETSKELLLSYIQLPHQISKTIKKIEEGKLTLHVKSESDETLILAIKRLTTLALGIGLGTFSYLFYQQGNDSLGDKFLYGLYFVGFIYMVQTVRLRK